MSPTRRRRSWTSAPATTPPSCSGSTTWSGHSGCCRRSAATTAAPGASPAPAPVQLGLPDDTPVVLSSYDIASTAIGVGAVNAGQSCSILGTTLCTEVVTQEVTLGEDPAGLTVPLGLPGKYLRAFPTFAGGEVIQWACQLLGLDAPALLGE